MFGLDRSTDALFPVPPGAAPRSWGLRAAVAVAQGAAVALGAALLLLRVPGVPPWESLYLDDYGTFLVGALQHPWRLFAPDRGYEQVLPHLIGQLVAYLPLAQAPAAFATFGALTAAACGLFVFHASAGHIGSVPLRALLGAAIVLLPVTPLEIADTTLGAPWYMLLALFWAMLWRPRTRTGMTVAALLALATAASTSLAVLFAPLLAARLYALRGPREHAVTAGWLAGCLVQLPVVATSYLHGGSPLNRPAPSGASLSFYAHDVVLPSLGWHLAWWLQSLAGRDGATAIVAVALAVAFGLILASQPQSRALVTTALLTGFAVTVFSTALNDYPATSPPVAPGLEPGARYTVLPIFLIESALIVGMDGAIRQLGYRRRSAPADAERHAFAGRPAAVRRLVLAPWTAVAAAGMVLVLGLGWIPDFRYQNTARVAYTTGRWGVIVAQWRHDCARSRTGVISEKDMRAIPRRLTIPCARLRL